MEVQKINHEKENNSELKQQEGDKIVIFNWKINLELFNVL